LHLLEPALAAARVGHRDGKQTAGQDQAGKEIKTFIEDWVGEEAN
jgi:hypothetical protein